MNLANPFWIDAAEAPPQFFTLMPPQGSRAVKAFCGIDVPDHDWHGRGLCALKARKGFGKSHLLQARSSLHRSSSYAKRTLFYPPPGPMYPPVDNLSVLSVVIPHWLQGRESVAAWVGVWQLSILGLLVWISGAQATSLRGYSDWFTSLGDLEKVRTDNNPDAPVTQRVNVILTTVMGCVLARLARCDDFVLGMNQLKQGLQHADADWSTAIVSRLQGVGKDKIAMYLDAPDELVDLSQPTLWRNVQQSLLLAIWKFAKHTTWNRLINIYASVRSEAFGSGHDHPDIALAMDLTLPLHYSIVDLELMLNDRIRQAAPERLSVKLDSVSRPIYALCGFERVVHEDRATPEGGRYTEDIFDSILRHSRLVPREVIGIAGAIYGINGQRSFESVRRQVNHKACQNIGDAIRHSFLGWNDNQHRALAVLFSGEVIDNKSMLGFAEKIGGDGANTVKFFVQHGLLGTAEPAPRRHRHCYLQRFSFDESHENSDATTINRDYFFVHPAFKEWIASCPETMAKRFNRLNVGIVGNSMFFEALQPIFRLCIVDDRVVLRLRNTSRRLSSIDHKDVDSDPLRFLFTMLWACRQTKQAHVTLDEMRNTLRTIKEVAPNSDMGKFDIPKYSFSLIETVRLNATRINNDPDIKKLQKLVLTKDGLTKATGDSIRRRRPFVSISARESIGTQIQASFPSLPLDEIDWSDALWKRIAS